ncbi:MAG: divalent-cation tolerance protein CutA [Planctomycetota bacterium]
MNELDSGELADGSQALIVIWTTTSTLLQAESIAKGLLGEADTSPLAACVQIDGPMTSWYRWKGQLEHETEHRVVIKTTRSLSTIVIDWLTANHPYEEPQIVAMPVIAVSDGYGRWVADAVKASVTDD